MAENGGPSTEEIVEDEDEKYNYYECKYIIKSVHIHLPINVMQVHHWKMAKKNISANELVRWRCQWMSLIRGKS